MSRLATLCLLATCAAAWTAGAQERPAPPPTPRLYVFDAGGIRGLDPQLFNSTREELDEVDFVNVAYLIVHPQGTLMFDAGGIPDDHFGADGAPVSEGVLFAQKPLLPQLAAAGYRPEDMDYL